MEREIKTKGKTCWINWHIPYPSHYIVQNKTSDRGGKKLHTTLSTNIDSIGVLKCIDLDDRSSKNIYIDLNRSHKF